MEILSFKIRGKMAHFRKYYANNTAFSFSIPPRTTIMGIVAAAAGWSRDSYYEKLSSECMCFGVRVLSPLKKSFHRLNFLSIKSLGDISKNWSSDFRGEGGRIQTPFEVVTGLDIKKDEVVYQVFAKPKRQGLETFESFKKQLLDENTFYNITFGVANFSASIYDVVVIKNNQIEKYYPDDYVQVHSAIPSHLVDDLKFEKQEFGNYNFVEEDMMPGDFVANNNREVKRMNRLLFSITPNPLRVKMNSSCYRLRIDETINIQFMDL